MSAGGAICLLSGGLDSTVALALERERGAVDLALCADYGQRAAAREVEFAGRIAQFYGVEFHAFTLPFFRELTGGALLTTTAALPHPDLERGGEALSRSADQVWVPNRNGVLIQVAAAWAESLGRERVIVGFNREEAATFPDNSEAFLQASNAALEFSTRGLVRVVAPTMGLDKAGILREGIRLGVPLELIWSCYEGAVDPCGRCESCRRLRRAASLVGVDPPGPV